MTIYQITIIIKIEYDRFIDIGKSREMDCNSPSSSLIPGSFK